MTKEEKFFIHLLERYSDYKNTTSDNVLKEWDELELTDFILSMYEFYHVEAIENAFFDIDARVEERKKSPPL